ncbi:MAG: hypothetical protein HY746_07545 [Elusimicrobia bacterium]|nr:hypothetical protein [Elusimicrobiota bacterium]
MPIVLFLLMSFAWSQEMDVSLLQKQDKFRNEVEEKIKSQILDPIFGAGRSFVFADVEFEIITRKADQSKDHVGLLQQYKERGAQQGQGLDADYILPGVPKPKSIFGAEGPKPTAATGSQAQQSKGAQEVRYAIDTEITRFQVTVAHDVTISSDNLKLAKERIDDYLLPYKIRKKNPPIVLFKATRFKSYNVLDDLKRPGVYLPLLYAVLFLLLLMFLFGPLWGFFRKYVNALVQKPGAEVNIESKTEVPQGAGGAGKTEGSQEGHQAIDMTFEQKEEEELMKKFEPFTYINEENLKKLIYMFLLKKEDPWVIAVVLSYLKPELSKKVLSMLPLELQTKIALESLAVKQVTREQVKAINKELREKVDFVVGGIERLAQMLEECDLDTKKNILEYLKTQKPEIYEKVRKVIPMFEDVVQYSDRDMQIIIRNVSNEDVARAIHETEPAITEKFFSNMSEGAAKTIKEIMEYSGQVTPVQVDQARAKILDAIKTLEANGSISPRPGMEEISIIDNLEMSQDSARTEKFKNIAQKTEEAKSETNPDEALQYFQTGIELYNQARYEESVSYFQYAVSLNPALGQAYQYLGSAYYSCGRIDESVSAYERYSSLSQDPAVAEWLANFKQQVGKQQ